MSTTRWTEIKARRAGSDERAGRAIRLASEIRSLREKKGLSQRQLAELVGTTQSANSTKAPLCRRRQRNSDH